MTRPAFNHALSSWLSSARSGRVLARLSLMTRPEEENNLSTSVDIDGVARTSEGAIDCEPAMARWEACDIFIEIDNW